ncbi:MAG: acyl-CoA thioesterase, partial [Tissierellales bacterium]
TFNEPATKGDVLNFEARLAKTGRTSFTVYGKITKNDSNNILSDGYITFVFVDEKGKPIPHNILLDDPIDEEDKKIRERASNLMK